MQMTINFNKLFNLQDSTSNTPTTTSIENSYHIDESSILSTPSNKINIHYKFNEGFFFDSSQDHQQNINILEDLSSIGRSQEDDLERESEITPVYGRKQQLNFAKTTAYTNKSHHLKQSKPQPTFYLSEKDTTKSPGERLYYQSKIKNERKLRQLERIKMELQQEEKKEATFKPALNQKSKKILQYAQSPFRKLENMKKSSKNQQSKKQALLELKSTAVKKQQEELRNCTFKPTILKPPKALISTPNGRSSSNKNLSTVFDSLYNQHRIKIQRQRKLLQQQQNQRKSKTGMLGKQQLQEFFNRNKQYIQEKKHREELLQLVSSQYDLTSGRKLFQPKINGSNGGQGGLTLARFNNSNNMQGYKQQQHNNSKTPKAGRQSQLHQPYNTIGKTHIRSNSSNLMNSNNHQLSDNKVQFKAKAYQLSKFTDQVVQQSYQHDQKNVDIQDDNDNKGKQQHLSYPHNSGIFNKTRIVEQLFQSNQQQSAQQQQLVDQQQQQSRHYNDDEDIQAKQCQQQLEFIGINKDYYNRQEDQQQQQQQLKVESEVQEQNMKNTDREQIDILQDTDNFHTQPQQTPNRKPSQDNDSIINRSTFLQSIVKNPIYSHKYHDLFALQSTQLPIHRDHSKLTHTPEEQNPINDKTLFKPLFLEKDSEEQENQEKMPTKSWEEIFNASTKIDKIQTVPNSQTGFIGNSIISQIKPNSSLPLEESPKKKAINIASLLKAKKKQVPKQ